MSLLEFLVGLLELLGWWSSWNSHYYASEVGRLLLCHLQSDQELLLLPLEHTDLLLQHVVSLILSAVDVGPLVLLLLCWSCLSMLRSFSWRLLLNLSITGFRCLVEALPAPWLVEKTSISRFKSAIFSLSIITSCWCPSTWRSPSFYKLLILTPLFALFSKPNKTPKNWQRTNKLSFIYSKKLVKVLGKRGFGWASESTVYKVYTVVIDQVRHFLSSVSFYTFVARSASVDSL